MTIHILLIEADSTIRGFHAMLLRQKGYYVSEAVGGEDGRESFHRDGADIVLVDRQLPATSGVDVTRQLRSTSNVPIIILSAQAQTEDIVASLEASADDYLARPVLIGELSVRICALVRRAMLSSSEGTATVPEGGVEVLPVTRTEVGSYAIRRPGPEGP